MTNRFQISFVAIDAQYLQTALLGICSLARVLASERPIVLDEEERPLALRNAANTPLTSFRLNPVLVQANTNTWSRKERRKHDQAQPGERDGSTTPQTNVQLMCSMQWAFDFTVTPANVNLESQWVFGDDRKMFEGLVAHIVKKLVQALEPYALRSWDYTPTVDSSLSGTRRNSHSPATIT